MEGESNVAGGNGATVMKAGTWVDGNFHPREIIGKARAIGNQRVVAARFIVRGGKQGVIQRIGAYAGVTAQGVAVKIVKGANGGKRYTAAFRRVRIDVIEVMKVNGILWLADNSERFALFNGLRPGYSG